MLHLRILSCRTSLAILEEIADDRLHCLKQIFLVELHKLVPQLLRHFTLELVDPTKGWNTSNRWFNKQTGLVVRLKRR